MPTIAAIATAFHPDERLAAVVEAALASCTAVVVVDNTPGQGPFLADDLRELPGVTVIRTGANRGLAGALNAGVAALTELGADGGPASGPSTPSCSWTRTRSWARTWSPAWPRTWPTPRWASRRRRRGTPTRAASTSPASPPAPTWPTGTP